MRIPIYRLVCLEVRQKPTVIVGLFDRLKFLATTQFTRLQTLIECFRLHCTVQVKIHGRSIHGRNNLLS